MSAEQIGKRGSRASLTAVQRAFYFVLPVLIIVGALIAYKSSAALTVIGKVSATGVFTPRGSVIPRIGASEAGVVTRELYAICLFRSDHDIAQWSDLRSLSS